MNLARASLCLGLFVLYGCATTQLPERTILLGEVAHIPQRDEVLNGFRVGPDNIPPPKDLMAGCGYDEKGAGDRKLVLVRYFYYWHNVASGIVRNGVKWTAAANDLALAQGNIVEVEFLPGRAGPDSRCATIKQIRSLDLTTAQCEFRKNQRNALGAFLDLTNFLGGPGSASLYCPFLEAEGWQKMLIGPYDAIAWAKQPVGVRN